MRTTDEAKADLLVALKHIRFAIEQARKTGDPHLGILSVREDGGGKVECKMDCAFIEDVALLIGAEPLSERDRLECSAQQFVDQHGLR